MKSLYEKYRPQKLGDVIGQAQAVRTVRLLLKRGWGGRAYWLSGPSGVGKTTLARLIAGHGASDHYIQELDSGWDFGNEDMARIEEDMHFFGGGKGGRAYIINEAHRLRQWIITKFLGVLERIPSHVVFIFTTTAAGQEYLFEGQIDAGPLLSRCVPITLKSKRLEQPFAVHVRRIATREKLNGKALAAYIDLARESKCNMRAMLQAVEAGKMLK